MSAIRSVLAYVVMLGGLVFFHELGHYLAARARGVTVEVFSIGFGPALLSRRARSGTRWQLSMLPLGGYVKMQGWGDDNATPALPGSFAGAGLLSKATIVAAGPLANLALAFLLFFGLFTLHGRVEVQPIISKVIAGSPAAAAGLQPGDMILNLGDARIRDFDDMVGIIVTHPDASLPMTLRRGGAVLQKQVMIGGRQVNGRLQGTLGVEGDEAALRRLGLPAAIMAAAVETWTDTGATLKGLYNLAVHHTGLHDLAGPIGIAQITGRVAAFGLPSLVGLAALISINLGLVNLMPIPILDGGHLLFYAGEALYGRPIPQRAQDAGLRLGFAIILSLFVFTTFNDLTRLGAIRWMAHLFG